MECNCKVTEIILAVIIFVFAVWPAWLGEIVSQWVIGIAAVLLIFHAFKCDNCAMPKSRKK